ncbi:hypothetical protein EGW08_000959, partial [Elysia chlorotica]
ELPPLPVGSTDTDADLDQGAVGGFKASCGDSTTNKKVFETPQQVRRAPPNDYADIRTLSRNQSRDRFAEAAAIQDNINNDLHYSGISDEEDLEDESHYSTLDEVRRNITEPPSIISTLPEVGTITAVGAEYAAPRDPAPSTTDNEYSIPRDPQELPDYQTPRGFEPENRQDNKDNQSGSELSKPAYAVMGVGAASNPMYSVPRSRPCDIGDIIPTPRLRY